MRQGGKRESEKLQKQLADRTTALQAQLTERTAKLQEMLNEGAFEMIAPIYGQTDRYGRDLRVIRRTRPDGSLQSIADEMRDSGLAHRYMGGFKPGWC